MEDERFVFCVNSATSLMLIVFPTQIDRQAPRALKSAETDDSALSSTQNTIISYLSEDIKSVREVFPEDQSMHMWSVLLTFFSPSSPLRRSFLRVIFQKLHYNFGTRKPSSKDGKPSSKDGSMHIGTRTNRLTKDDSIAS